MEKINEMYLSVTETTDSIYRTEDKIQKAYNNYIKLGDEDYIRELVELTNIKWKHKVMEYLRNRGCLDDDTLDDSLQKRNTEDQEMILMRMQEGVRDLVNASTGIYDYVIENREGEIDLVSSQIIELIEKQPKKSTTHDKALLIQRSLDQLLFCENLENQLKNSEEIHKSTFIF